MNFELTTTAPTGEASLTMSSREIADLTGKEHKNVLRDIKALLAGLKTEPSEFSGSYVDGTGRKLLCFNLPKRECLILVSGYSIELRAKIIDRWMELETVVASAPPIQFDPTDPQVLLSVFGALQAKVEEQKTVIAAQGEKVAALDRLGAAQGSMCLRDGAKTLKLRPIELSGFMSARRWIYKRAGNSGWIAYQDKIQSGLMEHIDHPYIDREGRERVRTQALITAKGLVKLAELLNKPLH